MPCCGPGHRISGPDRVTWSACLLGHPRHGKGRQATRKAWPPPARSAAAGASLQTPRTRQSRHPSSGGAHQLPARVCSTHRGRPWPRNRARNTAAKATAAVPAAEATRATGPRRPTGPSQVKPTDPGRLPAERAQTSRTSPSSRTRTHVCPRVHSALSSKRTRAAYTIHASNPSRRRICVSAPLYCVQNPRRRQNAVSGCSHTCSTEYVVNLSCTSREAWSTRSHPAAPLLRHADTAPARVPSVTAVLSRSCQAHEARARQLPSTPTRAARICDQ